VSLLTLDRVTKRFGGLTAVNQVTAEIHARDLVGIIGPNGAGKTTLFNLISGFYAPEEGKILFQGRNITGQPPYEISRRGLCRTFQLVKPFGKLSVLENVMIGALSHLKRVGEARREALKIIEFCHLEAFRDMPAKSLPTGLRKRLEVARALATRPRLLLLDEVMSGLNPTELQEMIHLLRHLHEEGITLLVIEHIMAVIMQLCQRILVLHHGEKIAEGTPIEISRNPRVIDAYLGEELNLA